MEGIRTGTNTPLAPMVVSPIGTCTSGVLLSTHWRKYQTYTWATCTVWWWFLVVVVVVVVVCVCGGGGCTLGVVVVGKCIGANMRNY